MILPPELETGGRRDDVADVEIEDIAEVVAGSVELDDEFVPAVQLALNPV